MLKKNRFILAFLQVVSIIAYVIGIFPLRYVPKVQAFQYPNLVACTGILLPLTSLLYPLYKFVQFSTFREYLGFSFFVQAGINTLYVTGSTTLICILHLKTSKAIVECSSSFMQSFRTIQKRYKRNHFEFDTFFLISVFTKFALVFIEVIRVDLGMMDNSSPMFAIWFKILQLVSSYTYFCMTIVYLMFGALFDNIRKALENGYERICLDNQIEDKEIYLDEVYDLYLRIRKSFEEFQECVNPMWALLGSYVATTVVFNFWELYLDISTDLEESNVLILVSSFLVLVIAASIVPFKGKRVERFFGFFCLSEVNSQQLDLEWIDYSKTLLPELNTTIVHGIKLHPFKSIMNSIIFVKTVELFIANNELFEKDEI